MTALVMLSAGEAQRLTQRIKLTASTVRDNLFKLRNLVEEAKNSNVWQVLGFQSWTAYLADTLADEPMRLGREERQELVGYLAGEGLSNRAIAPIVGVSEITVRRERPGATFVAPAPEAPAEVPTVIAATPPGLVLAVESSAETLASTTPEVVLYVNANTGEVDDEPERTVTGLDGKTYPVKPRTVPVLAGDDLARFDAEKNARSIGDMLGALESLTFPEHRERVLEKWWPAGSGVVSPTKRDLLTPAHLRGFADALVAFANELEART